MLGRKLHRKISKTKESRTSPARLSFALKVQLCNLRPSTINSAPCDQIVIGRGYVCS